MLLERLGPTSFAFRAKYEKSPEWEQWFLLLADIHHDNPHCDRKLLKRLMDHAVERDAGVMVFGDLFCAMQGKFDKRSAKSDVRSEHQVSNYLDALVETTADWHAPYADRLLLASMGNHEWSILERHETNLITRFADRLNNLHGGSCVAAPWAGWVMFRMHYEASGGQTTGHRQTIKLHYDHGYGGSAPVTKGVIQSNRRATYLPDADIVVSGHIHESWMVELERERVTAAGTPFLDTQTHLCLPTLKEEYLPGEGWHRHTGKAPKPMGGWWIRLYHDGGEQKVRYECIRAK